MRRREWLQVTSPEHDMFTLYGRNTTVVDTDGRFEFVEWDDDSIVPAWKYQIAVYAAVILALTAAAVGWSCCR